MRLNGLLAGKRGQGGFATIEVAIGFCFMVLLAAGLMVTTAWPAQINAANAAAYEAARAAVEAPDAASGEDLGRQRAAEVMANHGFDAPTGVTFTTAGRGEALTATVTVMLPALRFPLLGSWDAVEWSKSHTQRVPDYRGFG